MDKETKSNFMLKGMLASFKEKENGQLFNRIVGIKFKNIRLNKNMTAEAVVQDNKEVLSDVHSLYKFEQGTFHFGKLYALANYYKVDANDLFKL